MENLAVVGLAALPSSFSLCRPAGRRRWGSLVSVSSTAASCLSGGEADAENPDEVDPPVRLTRKTSVDSEDLEIVMSPSGFVRKATFQYELSTAYSLYFDPGHSRKKKVKNKDEYEQSLVEVGSINTVHEYWQYFNNINFESMAMLSDLSIFKKGMKPLWETKENENGGRFIVSGFKKEKSKLYFERVVLAFLGQQFSFHNDTNGIVLSVRHRGNNISLWTHSVDHSLFVPMDSFLRCLLDDPDINIEFRDHHGAISQNQYKRMILQGGKSKKTAAVVAMADPKEREWQEAMHEAVLKSRNQYI